jgi:serine/threonine protein kinase/formylglycine-generating enzyme required for sulfatase activity
MTEETIFAAALELPLADRAAYLAGACGNDTALRKRVEGLLTASDRAGEFMARPAVAPAEGPAARTGFVDGQASPYDETVSRVGSEKGADDEVPLGFLAPGRRPGSLGRIGHFEVLEVLGKGGFGIVFRAFDEVLQRVVALKVMAPQLAATSPARKRFLREARSSAQVRHENVVQVYEVAEHPLPYLAMEFIPGETLQQRLDRIGPVEPVEVVRVGRQIAEGLTAAHAMDLIHRDIKPSNILLESGQEKVRLTDFGLARAADDASISQSGIIAGTPMNMAPEQAKGERLDQRADLFSLGSVLYQMVAGRPPFRANCTVAVLKRVAEDTPRDIREIIPETPQWLCDIIAKLHAKNPDERYQTAREVAEVLADCEAQLKANAKLKDFSRIPRSKTKPSGRRSWMAMAAVLFVPAIALALTEITGVTHLLREKLPTAAGARNTGPNSDATIDPKAPIAAGNFALAFDGERSLVKIPSLKIIDDHALTVETWALLDRSIGQPRNQDLVGNANLSGFVLCVSTNSSGVDGTKLAFAIRLKNLGSYLQAWEKQPVPRNQLVHFAGVYDGKGEIRLYVNGQLQSRTPAHGIKPSSMYLTLGSNHDGNKSNLLGRMNEVRISKVVRYDNDFTPAQRFETDKDTIALYHFDEGQGEILTDSSGNGHHGEIVAAKWVKADGSPIDIPPPAKRQPKPPTTRTPLVAKQAQEAAAKRLGIPVETTNSIAMKFVLVPKGKSWLGGGNRKLGDQEVEIRTDFYLGKYEVTQGEWEVVMGENPSHFSRTGRGAGAVKDFGEADLKRFPVENVSWDQCQLFVAKLNQLEKEMGWVYRLPTETEWEYACRGGPMVDRADGAFDFYFAEPTNTLMPELANYDKQLDRTCKVGSYEPNMLGLFDMHGNVCEWCQGTVKAGEQTSREVHRGGGWDWDAKICPTKHSWTPPPSASTFSVGLRLARVPSGTLSPK